jgi:hypothetical protein
MSSQKKPETPVRIESESTFREKVWLTGSPVTLEWKKDQVLETTEGALTKLRDELSGKESADEKRKTAEEFLRSQEQSEASESIEDKLEKAISSWVTDKLKASGIAVWVAAWATAVVHQLDSQIEKTTGVKVGLKESMREWFKEAMKDNTFFLGFLWKALYHAFGWIDQAVAAVSSSETPNPVVERFEDMKAQKIAKQLFDQANKWRPEPLPSDVLVYFNHPTMLGMSFKSIVEMKKKYDNDPSGLEKEFKAEKPNTGKFILQAMTLVLGNESYFQSFFAQDTWWKEKPIKDTLTRTLPYVNFFSKLKTEKWEIDFSGFSFSKISEWLEWAADHQKELLKNIQLKYAWCTPKVIGLLHDVYKDKWVAESLDLGTRNLWEDETKFLRETIPAYGKNLQSFIIGNFSFWEEKLLQSYFQKSPLKQSDVIDFFILSWWSTDPNTLNHFQQAFVCSKVFLLLRGQNNDSLVDGSDAYKYMSAIGGALTSEKSKIKMPEWVKTLLKESIDIMLGWIKKWIEEIVMMSIGAARNNPLLTAAIVTVIGLVMYFWGGAVLALGRWALALKAVLTATFLAWWYTVVADDKINPKDKTQIPQSQLDTVIQKVQTLK